MYCATTSSRALALVLLVQIGCGNAATNLAVPWSATYYGPDGPWTAITVQVGGVNSQGTSQVDLYPSGKFGSMILSKDACTNYADTPCGKGGFWEPSYTDSTDTNYRADWTNNAGNYDGGGEEYIQAVTINGRTVSNVPLVSIDEITYNTPGGKKYGPELGMLALGGVGDSQVQDFVTATSENASSGFMVTAGLFNKSIIPSYAYGLHIGAAAFDYGGSLVLGGYDQGRLLGKYTNYTEGTVQLLDIVLGVETGGSPFSDGLKSQSGLLRSNLSEPSPLTINADPGNPYLYLPGKTCEEISKLLPVSYDTSLRYYLWDTDDPSYEKIITSPAYLGFVFPPATGETANVTIKVPFALLNLTLDTPIVSKPTPYFPCNDFTPLAGDTYRLGRAFLQAAFIGHNYRTSSTWLGQAPGPGPSRNGLGETRKDIADDDVSIEPSEDDGNTFAESWSSYWTVLADDSSPTESPSATSSGSANSVDSSSNSKGFSPGAVVGIVIGALVLLLAVVATLLWRRRRSKAHQADEQALDDIKCPYGCGNASHIPPCPYYVPPAELWTEPAMLPGPHLAHELPGGLGTPRELDGGWVPPKSHPTPDQQAK